MRSGKGTALQRHQGSVKKIISPLALAEGRVMRTLYRQWLEFGIVPRPMATLAYSCRTRAVVELKWGSF